MEITLENKIDLYYLLKKNYSNLYYWPILMGHPVYTSPLRLLPLRGWRKIISARGAWVTLVNYKADNISKYVCLTVIIDIT